MEKLNTLLEMKLNTKPVRTPTITTMTFDVFLQLLTKKN